LSFSPDGERLASAGNGTWIRIWDVLSGDELAHVSSRGRHVNAVAYSPAGDLLAAGGKGTGARFWDAATLRKGREVRLGWTPVMSVCFTPSGGQLICVDSGRLDILGSDRPGPLSTCLLGSLNTELGGFADVACSPDGQLLAAAVQPRVLLLGEIARMPASAEFRRGRDLPAGLRFFHVDWTRTEPHVLRRVAFSTDGRYLAAALGPDVILLDPADGRRLATFAVGQVVVRSLAFSPDGLTLATAGYDGTVRLLDVSTGAERACYDWGIGKVDCVVFSPDGMHMAAGGGVTDEARFDFSGGGARIAIWDVDASL
jgi:WD40 repeat protein